MANENGYGSGSGKGSGSNGPAGGHDFTTDPKGAPHGGAPTNPLKSYPSGALSEPDQVDPASIPAGGKILKADPRPVSAKISGVALPPQSVPSPMKGLK
jgi:hypothetical protein